MASKTKTKVTAFNGTVKLQRAGIEVGAEGPSIVVEKQRGRSEPEENRSYMTVAGGAMMGAGFGAVAGSVVPGVGTALGAAAGAAIGAGMALSPKSNLERKDPLSAPRPPPQPAPKKFSICCFCCSPTNP